MKLLIWLQTGLFQIYNIFFPQRLNRCEAIADRFWDTMSGWYFSPVNLCLMSCWIAWICLDFTTGYNVYFLLLLNSGYWVDFGQITVDAKILCNSSIKLKSQQTDSVTVCQYLMFATLAKIKWQKLLVRPDDDVAGCSSPQCTELNCVLLN